jgi:hypothetical protein
VAQTAARNSDEAVQFASKNADELGEEASDRARQFAHGSHLDNIDDIVQGGLREDAALAFSKGGSENIPGSFFTMEIPPRRHLQAAYEFGMRHAAEPAVLVTELPNSLVESLVERGLATVRNVPGAEDLVETIFSPRAFQEINDAVRAGRGRRTIIDPYGRR